MKNIFKVMFPNIITTIVPIGILSFRSLCNEVLSPLIVIQDKYLISNSQMVTLFSVGGGAEGKLGVKLAVAVVLTLPIMRAYAFF
jgi:multiple sugar transport system permease protein